MAIVDAYSYNWDNAFKIKKKLLMQYARTPYPPFSHKETKREYWSSILKRTSILTQNKSF